MTNDPKPSNEQKFTLEKEDLQSADHHDGSDQEQQHDQKEFTSTDFAAGNAAPFDCSLMSEHISLSFTTPFLDGDTARVLDGDAAHNFTAALSLTMKGGKYNTFVEEYHVDRARPGTFTFFHLQVFDNILMEELIDVLVEFGERLRPLAVARRR